MNPIRTLHFCARLGYSAFALLAPDIALVVLPALGLLTRHAARPNPTLRPAMLEAS